MLQISFTGPECSGKSTLASAMCELHHCLLLEEYARAYLSTRDSNYEMKDILAIFKEHQLRYNRAIAKKPDMIIMDTDLLVLKIWAKFKFSFCPKPIEDAWQQLSIDHYFLCAPDFPWIYDPLRENPHNRLELFKLYELELVKMNRPYTILKGDYENRLSIVNSTVLELKARGIFSK